MSEPRTEAGRRFMDGLRLHPLAEERQGYLRHILAIEQEAAVAVIDVERLALYIHQARTSNDEPVFDMAEAQRRANEIIRRLQDDGT